MRNKKQEQKRLADNLISFLNEHSALKEECEVLYLMVQIRKILDCGGNSYKTLRFYSNWVLHSELSKTATTKLLVDIFDAGIDGKKDGRDNARNLISSSSSFFTLNTFKNDLKGFVNEHNLPGNILSNANWKNIRRLLLELIKDCPVSFVPTEIINLRVIKDNEKTFSYRFTLANKRKPVIKQKI